MPGREVFQAEAVVIGAGVVGLAVAAALARSGAEVLILEKNRHIGEETSSRNSEVIHAGLYYDAGSLKGRFCAEGRDRLYDWCRARGVAHAKCGKLIVAAKPGDEPALERIVAKAAGVGVYDLEPITGAQAMAMEPALAVSAALWSPKTGVIDSHGLMTALLAEAEDHGAALALGAPITGGALIAGAADGARLRLFVGGDAPAEIRAGLVVNAAGLWAQDVSRAIEGVASQSIPPRVLTKGNYFALTGRAPFTRLIYPTPPPGGLGVHLTLDLSGAARFGPDVEPLSTTDPAEIDYTVDPSRGDSFYAAIRDYWPGLPDGALHPAYAGVRPKIDPNYRADFRIDGPAEHGAPGYVALYGFESPALTGCLAIGEHVAGLVRDQTA